MADTFPNRPSGLLADLSRTLTLGNERLFYAAVALSIAPLWTSAYLPLVDLPQHAAQVTALRQLLAGDPELSEAFQINWFTPYLLGYLLLYVLTAVLPITVATKLVVSAAIAAVPFLTGRLLRVIGGHEAWKWLAIPCSFSFAFYWGFLTYVLAVPMALLFLIQSARFVATPSVGRGISIAAFSILLFFCHIIVLGFASLVSLAYVIGAHYRDWKTLAWRALPYTAPLPLIGAWLVRTYTSETGVQGDTVVFGSTLYRLTQLFAQPAGREDAFSSFAIVLLVTGGVLFLPWLAGAKFSRDPKRWLPFAVGLTAFSIAPHYVLSTAYFYQRLGVFLVPLWLAAWDVPSSRWRLDRLAMPLIAFWIVSNASRFVAFARETESFTTVLAAMEPGRRTAAMVFDNRSAYFALPVYLHFPAWYQAMTGGIVDFNFAEFYSQLVRYRAGVGPRISETVAWYATAFDWTANGGDGYDYFLIKASFDVSNEVFKEQRGSVELVTQSGWWWLYRNVKPRNEHLALANCRPAVACDELVSVPP